MKKSLVKMLGVAAITWSLQTYAAGIGGINVLSALGEPLKADIELVSVSKDEKSSLVARLASPEAYKSAGFDYPYNNKFKFTIENRADGSSYVHATSAQPVNEPYVTLLVELGWASGKVSREYTFLLDPPGYQAEQPVAAPVQTLAPVVVPAPAATVETVPIVNQSPAAAPDAAGVMPVEMEAENETPVEARPVKARAAKAKPQTVAANQGDITVHSGDTLNKIAAANKVDGVSLERMMVALYRANADQFDGQNMNRIRTGKILRQPDAAALATLSQSDAVNEIHAQVGDWNAYRQKLASAAPASAQQASTNQVSSGKVKSSVADKTPVTKDSAKEVLKLSKGTVPSDKAAAGKTSKQEKDNAAQEEAIAKAKAADEERSRTAMLEKNIQDMKHLAELKTQAAALALAASAPKPVVVSQVVAVASAVQAASVVQVAAVVSSASAVVSAPLAVSDALPVIKHTPPVQPTAVEPSLLDDVLGNPSVLGGGAAVLLGLSGLGYAMYRRKNRGQAGVEKSFTDSHGAATAQNSASVSSSNTGDFSTQAVVTQTLVPMASEDDPISEAELFLSFGRDVQAEEILQDALHTVADKTPVKLKLLEIYASRKDSAAFENIAAQLKDAGDLKAWKKAEAMGLKLDPHNPLYGGVSHVEESPSATMHAVMSPNFGAMPASPVASVAAPVAAAVTPQVSDDLTAAFSVEHQIPEKKSLMDFDVTGGHGNAHAGSASTGLDDLDFDVTATHPPMPAHPDLSHEHASGDTPFMMDFAIHSGQHKAVAPAKPAEFNFSDIDLNMSGKKPAAEAEHGSDHWQDVATKLDLAKVYHEMGDAVGAKDILAEVLQEGDAEQRAAAQAILNQLG